MSKFMMYYEIHRMKREGSSLATISRVLGINRRTATKYLGMSEQDYERHLIAQSERSKMLLPYEGFVRDKLVRYPDTSAAQMFDWLKEHHPDLPAVSSRTVFNFVIWIREKYNIPRDLSLRDSGMVEELPYGLQMQVDFGNYNMRRGDGRRTKVYFFALVLSRSRYKYTYFSDRPFTTEQAIEAHEAGFAFFGGITREVVYDQDRLFLVSENHGDLILTNAFREYVRQRGFELHFCRKGDPQSKGKVENMIRYVKQNFLYNRTFHNLETLQDEAINWLARTANALEHAVTGKIPYDEWIIEQPLLAPYTPVTVKPTPVVATVRKDNTICYRSNYYSLPLGTYRGRGTWVTLTQQDGHLLLSDRDGHVLCDHTLASGKGQKIIKKDHKRDKSAAIDELIDQVAGLLEEPEPVRSLLAMIRKDKPRYIRDQILLLRDIIQGADSTVIKQALEYALENRIASATDFRALVTYYGKQNREKSNRSNLRHLNPLGSQLPKEALTQPEKSDIADYDQLLNGN